MKSRSHRLPPSDPSEDWIDGSWTVDCSCGVTFDDGEEMVSCDECGVWVHTRCSHFVKGESSFACHNCKKKRSLSTPVAADTEETEVAQLLVELPTKTDPCPPPGNPFLGFRLWAEAPLEDRVHVQGVPGGDEEFFKGITSSVFTKHLWKCSGYVPKKFNFQYREFSCLDGKDGGENENENTLSQGADVLFSLSKEVVHSSMPVRALERKKEGEKVLLQGWGRKERNRLRVFSSKRRNEELAEGKDRSVKKKKARSCADRVMDVFKKRGSVLADDMKKAGVSEDAESDVRIEKSEERKEDCISHLNTHDKLEGMGGDSQPKHVLVIKASKGGAANEALRKKNALEMRVKVETEDTAAMISSEVDVSATSHKERIDIAEESGKKEDVSKAVHGLKQPKGESNFQGDLNEGSCPVVVESKNSRNATENFNVPDTLSLPVTGNLPDSIGAISLSSKLHKHDAETDRDDARDVESMRLLSSPVPDGNLPSMNHSAYLQQKATLNTPDNGRKQETLSLPPGEHKSGDNDNEYAVNIQEYVKVTDQMETEINEPKQHVQAVEESGGSSTAHENSFEAVHSSKFVEEATTEDSKLSHATPDVHKLVLETGKDSLTSHVPVISKKSVSASQKSACTSATSNAGKTVHISKQHRLKMSRFITNKKDASTSSSADEGMRRSRHSEKTLLKGLDPPRVKSSQTSKSSSKHTLSRSKEQPCEPSLKELAVASKSVNTTILSVSCEKIESSQTQNGSAPSKLASSGSCQKSDKLSHPVPQPLSKLLCHSMSMHPPTSAGGATTLSDEELALLLHQELNSSPRVPRVPRMRQTFGMPVASQSAPSMLSKRLLHSGGKDQVFRRKNKEEASKGVSRNSQESNDETKRAARAMSPPNCKYRESAFITDSSSRKGLRNRSPDTAAYMKKNMSGESTECETSCPFETRGKSALSVRSSRDCSDDTTPRTLPGLIDEILSKHKCSTYEQLCDAVRPHWHKVRKPNGDRYAYSSHSHAVLDCLRNRSEWAHLIDRGPKTNSSKRRKHDSDTAAESENEEANNRASREVEEKNGYSHQEDFPKGKRNARKRKRLELRGQSANKARKRKHTTSPGSGILSNDDDKDDDVSAATLSHSSNDLSDGILSEDESQGAEASSTSTSSDSSR